MDEAATKEELRPVKKQLKDLKLSGEDMPREKKVAILKDSLSAIGRRIEVVLKAKAAAGEDAARWKRHLWTYGFFGFEDAAALLTFDFSGSSHYFGRRRSRRQNSKRYTGRWS